MQEISSPGGAADAANDKLSLSPLKPFRKEQISTANALENSTLTEELLKIVPLVSRIVRRNLCGTLNSQEADDVEQRVLLSLWQWRGRNSDRILTTTEMEKIAARSAKRGVFAYYRQQMRNITNPQVDFDSNNDVERGSRTNFDYTDADNYSSENCYVQQNVSFTGDTLAEETSLGKFLFQAIEKLSMRQRFALLLQKSDLIVHLLAIRACYINDLAALLKVSRIEFLEILRHLPLSDEQIGELCAETKGKILSAKQVREARFKARQNIKQALE